MSIIKNEYPFLADKSSTLSKAIYRKVITMEHRCTRRIKASRDVIIQTRTGQILNGFLRNISREGMYIQIETRHIRKLEMIDVELSSGCCIRGWILHIDDEGVGVLFIPPQADATDRSSPPIPLSNTCLRCLETDKTT